MTQSPKKRLAKTWPALALAGLALVMGCYVAWRLDTAPRTDDAYASADVIDVVPDVSGRIVEMRVSDNQRVAKGEVLFRIDPRPFDDELAKATASLVALDKQIELTSRAVTAQQYGADSAHAAVGRASAAAAQAAETLRRTEPLLGPGYVSAEDVDRARTTRRAAEADLLAARLQAQQATVAVSSVDALVAQRDVVLADIALAQLRLDMTTVRAPFNGRVVSLKTTVGQFASPLKPVFTLIDTDHWYVVANFRETELRDIRAGAAATVYLMGDTGKRFRGQIDSIGYGVLPGDGGLVLEGLPRVQRTINWVRVAQRFPVKIRVDDADPELFRVGASAVAMLSRQPADETRQAGRGQ